MKKITEEKLKQMLTPDKGAERMKIYFAKEKEMANRISKYRTDKEHVIDVLHQIESDLISIYLDDPDESNTFGERIHFGEIHGLRIAIKFLEDNWEDEEQ